MFKNNDKAMLFKIALFFIMAIIYLYIMIFSSRYVYRESLFFLPKITFITAVINSSIIILCSFLISSETIKWLKKCNKKFIIILICIFLIYPFFFLKSGIVVDSKYIRKNNILGNSIEIYSYSDIKNFEISVKYGVQYDITFNSQNTINLCSHEVPGYNYFKNDKNLKIFDELLENHSKRTVYKTIYSTPQNLKRFFRKNEYYDYFNQIFNSG